MPSPKRKLLPVICAALVAVIAALLFTTFADDGQREIAGRAREVLNRRCFACHGASGIAKKNVFVLERERLIAARIVVPGDGSSLLLRAIESGAMPLGGPALPDEEKRVVREWVISGASSWDSDVPTKRVFIDEPAILAYIKRDLLSQPDRSRSFLRYFSLAHLYNSGIPDRELATYRQALGKLINSLSWHKEITRPAAIDPAGTLFRIDLRDYKWTSANWDLLLSTYPYALRSEESGAIARLSGAQSPYVRADWFAATASLPPLYHDLLGLPRTAGDLERMLGVDSARDLAEESNVARAGLRASGVSQNNRVLERHSSVYGAYWKSFDFRNNIDQQNIFQHPLGFNPAGSEIVFNLPNGLQAYMVVDASGRRINEAPVAIVSDRSNPDEPVIRTGQSCMRCHYDGVREFREETRAAIQANYSGSFDREKALALYAPQERLDNLIELDRERFGSAVKLASGAEASAPQQEPVNALARRFAADLSLAQAASETGLEAREFQDRITRNARLMQLGYAQLLVERGAIKRDAWDRNFGELSSELSLGRPITRAGSIDLGLLRSTVERTAPIAAASTPDSILRTARTISVSSMTMFLNSAQLEDELRKRPEFEQMGLVIVKDATKADLMIDLDRPVFTYTFTYSVSSADTRIVVTSGKVTAFDGNFAAPKIAKELIERFHAAREDAPEKPKKK